MPEILLRGGPCNGQRVNVDKLEPEYYAIHDPMPFKGFNQPGLPGMPPSHPMERVRYVRFRETTHYMWSEIGAENAKPKREWTVRVILLMVLVVAELSIVVAGGISAYYAIKEPGHFNYSFAFDAILFILSAIYLAVCRKGLQK
jgi:hypothetical protein